MSPRGQDVAGLVLGAITEATTSTGPCSPFVSHLSRQAAPWRLNPLPAPTSASSTSRLEVHRSGNSGVRGKKEEGSGACRP